MKFIKRFFIGLFLLLVVALIAGLFMKKDYHIERNVTIDAQKDKVFDYIKHLKNQVRPIGRSFFKYILPICRPISLSIQ